MSQGPARLGEDLEPRSGELVAPQAGYTVPVPHGETRLHPVPVPLCSRPSLKKTLQLSVLFVPHSKFPRKGFCGQSNLS